MADPHQRMHDPNDGRGFTDADGLRTWDGTGTSAGGVSLLASSINTAALALYRRWRRWRGREE